MITEPLETPANPRRASAPADYDQHTVGRVGRLAMTGALLGSVILGTLVTLGALAATADLGQALGIGVAVALTGGPFFGGLVGFALAVHAAENAPSTSPDGSAAEPLVAATA